MTRESSVTFWLFLVWLASCVVLVGVVWATLAHAGTITFNFGAAQTITTTAAQDARLTRVLQAVNSTRDPGNQFATVELWLRDVLLSAVGSYVQQADQHNAADACTAYKALTPAQRNTIDTQLGGKSPCAP